MPSGVAIPAREVDRQKATERYGILDTPPEEVFDRLTALAVRLFNVPMAVISLTHVDREWLKARHGIDLPEIPRKDSFCVHLVEQGGVLVVIDARKDPRFVENPLVTGPPFVRFYAGASMTTSDGFNIGSVSIADTVPRDFSSSDRRLLSDLASIAMDEMELRHRGVREAAELTERYRLVARATNDAIWDWDLITGSVWRSGGFETLFGYSRGQLAPEIDGWGSRVHPDDVGSARSALRTFVERGGESSWSSEYRFRRADGSWAEVLDRGYLLRDPAGKPLRMIGAMTDLTERKRAERAQAAVLRIAEAVDAAANLAELLRSIHQIIAGLMPAENFYIALQRGGTQIIDFPYLVDQHHRDNQPRNVGRGLTAWVLRTGEPLLVACEADFDELVRKGEVESVGAPSVSWVGVPLKSQDRTVGVLVAQSYTAGLHYGEREKELLRFVSTQVARAIERKQAEESLRESERRFRALIENSSDGTAVISPEGEVAFRSASVPRILGYAEDFQMGLLMDYIHPDDRAAFGETWQEVLSKPGVPVRALARTRHLDGSYRALEGVLVDLISDPAVRGVVVNFRDVTERKQIEAQLLAADRMVSIGTLAAGVAHEINNPLSYVIANLSVAIDALAGVQDVKVQATAEALREAQQGAERVRQIVRDLKTFSRSDDAASSPVDVHRVIDAAVNMAWNEIRHRARLVKDFGRDLPPALANEPRLGQVLLNLLVNAAHAIPEGNSERNEIRIITRAAGANLVVEVKDSGSGIPPEHLARLFDPFFTTKPVGLGTGLGLFICQGIVRSLGGTLAVESEVGKGSLFRVTLPATEAARSPAEESAPAPVPVQAAPRGRILAIDDEPLVGAVLARTLAAHDVLVLTSAAEALAKIRAGGTFDLIFCDLMMPHMTGMEFFAALQEESPELAKRVVFLTGGAFTKGARDFLDRTAAVTVEKPFDLKSIRALVADLLRSRS